MNGNKGDFYTYEKKTISSPKNTKTIEELTVMPYTIYYMNSNIDTITINKINASKLKNFETFSFVLNSFGDNKLTIKNKRL